MGSSARILRSQKRVGRENADVRQCRDGLVFSPSDLKAFLACPHLAALELAAARGQLEKPFRVNLHADLIRRKGEEHERGYLDELRASDNTISEPQTAAALPLAPATPPRPPVVGTCPRPAAVAACSTAFFVAKSKWKLFPPTA